jgi:hypothetical protein
MRSAIMHDYKELHDLIGACESLKTRISQVGTRLHPLGLSGPGADVGGVSPVSPGADVRSFPCTAAARCELRFARKRTNRTNQSGAV